jgi:hypothetical protein
VRSREAAAGQVDELRWLISDLEELLLIIQPTHHPQAIPAASAAALIDD